MPIGCGSSRPTPEGHQAVRHYVRTMRGRNWGRIVSISSESAVQIPTEMIHHGMTKTAQLAVARGLGGGVVRAIAWSYTSCAAHGAPC